MPSILYQICHQALLSVYVHLFLSAASCMVGVTLFWSNFVISNIEAVLFDPHLIVLCRVKSMVILWVLNSFWYHVRRYLHHLSRGRYPLLRRREKLWDENLFLVMVSRMVLVDVNVRFILFCLLCSLDCRSEKRLFLVETNNCFCCPLTCWASREVADYHVICNDITINSTDCCFKVCLSTTSTTPGAFSITPPTQEVYISTSARGCWVSPSETASNVISTSQAVSFTFSS